MKPQTKVEKTFRLFNWNDLWWRDVKCDGYIIWWFWPLCGVEWRKWKQFSGGQTRWKEMHFVWNVKKCSPEGE